MKNKLSFLFSAILLINISFARAQNIIREGKLTFAITFPEMDPQVAGVMKTTMGEPVMYFKNGSTRYEMTTPAGGLIMIYNKQKNISYNLINMAGNKYAMVVDSARVDSLKKASAIVDSTQKAL